IGGGKAQHLYELLLRGVAGTKAGDGPARARIRLTCLLWSSSREDLATRLHRPPEEGSSADRSEIRRFDGAFLEIHGEPQTHAQVSLATVRSSMEPRLWRWNSLEGARTRTPVRLSKLFQEIQV